jgi:hypothetical protein
MKRLSTQQEEHEAEGEGERRGRRHRADLAPAAVAEMRRQDRQRRRGVDEEQEHDRKDRIVDRAHRRDENHAGAEAGEAAHEAGEDRDAGDRVEPRVRQVDGGQDLDDGWQEGAIEEVRVGREGLPG